MNGYLQDTLHGILNCKCKGNCILKSLHVDKIENHTAYITVEPYDDAFNQNQVDDTIQRIKRIMWKRKKAIWQSLDVHSVSVTIYDEWTMKDSFVLSMNADEMYSTVN
ncbi:hypothetical protein [Salinicoccus albus]|uniref:hypothetical protein n=1 Tax=Salinicoccus albus TaxID=418756 RepID=UPI00037C715F|nr:hypothetical protein [Salinicoccus albus]